MLRFFPRVRPANPAQPVQVLVTGSHQVTLPDMGGSNRLPSTLGAGLVIVYRVTGYDPASGLSRRASRSAPSSSTTAATP